MRDGDIYTRLTTSTRALFLPPNHFAFELCSLSAFPFASSCHFPRAVSILILVYIDLVSDYCFLALFLALDFQPASCISQLLPHSPLAWQARPWPLVGQVPRHTALQTTQTTSVPPNSSLDTTGQTLLPAPSAAMAATPSQVSHAQIRCSDETAPF